MSISLMLAGCGTPGLTAPVLCPDPPVDPEHIYECEGVPVTDDELMTVCHQPVECRSDADGTRLAVCLVVEERDGTPVIGRKAVECGGGRLLLSQDFVDVR
jgi:hypothetical protein